MRVDELATLRLKTSKVIGITGPIAAGKTTFAEILNELIPNSKVYTMSDTLRMILDGKYPNTKIQRYIYAGPPLKDDRETMLQMGAIFREKYGDDILMKLTLGRIETPWAIIDGIRGMAEAGVLVGNGILIFIDAPEDIRYERLVKRKAAKDRNITSREKFREINRLEDEQFNIYSVKDIATFYVENTGSLEDLREKAIEIVRALGITL